MYSNIFCLEFESYIQLQMNRIVYDRYCQNHPTNNEIYTKKRQRNRGTFSRE